MPGITSAPSASISRVADPSIDPTSTMRPLLTATSAVRGVGAGAVDDGPTPDDQVVLSHARVSRPLASQPDPDAVPTANS